MYLPYLQNRYANPLIEKISSMQTVLRGDGELCFIKKGDQRIAGVLFNQIGDTYYLLTIGLIDESYLKEGAIAAMYYYGIQHATEKKAKFIDFGLTRPFLSDGVLIYKRKWGAKVTRDPASGRVLYLKNLVKTGQIVLEGTKLKVLESADADLFSSEDISAMGLEVKANG